MIRVDCDRCEATATVTTEALRVELHAAGWNRAESDESLREGMAEGVFYLRCTSWPPGWHGRPPGAARAVHRATGRTS